MKANILITSAGQRVSLVRYFQKEIKKINVDNKVFTIDSDPILAPACHISDGAELVSSVTEPTYISEVLKLCEEWDIKLLIPTIDTELLILAENKQRFVDIGVHLIISSLDFILTCRDKRRVNIFFEKHNIGTPDGINKNDPSFPLFIKPYDGSNSKDIFLIENQEELTDYHLNNEKLMFMEYISPEAYDEYTVDTYYDKKGYLKCVVPRKRIYVRAGEVNKGVTHKNEVLDYVKEKLPYIEGAVGCLTMQFFFNQKTKHFIGIEINPRFGGGYPLSYLSGANYPRYLIEEYILDKDLSYFEGWEENLLMLRYDDEVLVRDHER